MYLDKKKKVSAIKYNNNYNEFVNNINGRESVNFSRTIQNKMLRRKCTFSFVVVV